MVESRWVFRAETTEGSDQLQRSADKVTRKWKVTGIPRSRTFPCLICLNYLEDASNISSVAGTFWARISASPLLSGNL